MEKSCPGKKGQPPSRVNLSKRLYEKYIDPFAWVKGSKQRSRKIWLRRLDGIVPSRQYAVPYAVLYKLCIDMYDICNICKICTPIRSVKNLHCIIMEKIGPARRVTLPSQFSVQTNRTRSRAIAYQRLKTKDN